MSNLEGREKQMKTRCFPLATLLSLLLTSIPALAQSTTEPRLGTPVAGESRRAVVTTSATIIYRPDATDSYPQTSRQLREAGTVRVKMCYGITGRIVEATVDESSGFPRLDEAAVRMSRLYRVRVGTVDGLPVTGCLVEPISFGLAQP
jgi:protein TonB